MLTGIRELSFAIMLYSPAERMAAALLLGACTADGTKRSNYDRFLSCKDTVELSLSPPFHFLFREAVIFNLIFLLSAKSVNNHLPFD